MSGGGDGGRKPRRRVNDARPVMNAGNRTKNLTISGGHERAGTSIPGADSAAGIARHGVRVELGRGGASTTVWTCDFSYDYVKINAEYRT